MYWLFCRPWRCSVGFVFRGVGPSPLGDDEDDAPEAYVAPFVAMSSSERVARKACVCGFANSVCDFLANFTAPAISPSAFLR